MKKYLFLILLIFSFVACNKTTKEEEPVLELIAYHWKYDEQYQLLANGKWGDTIISHVTSGLYAQIYKDGDCFATKQNGSYKDDLYSNFKIDTALLNPALRIFKTVKVDTVMIKPCSYLYDGPLLRLIGKGKSNKEISLIFDVTDCSNSTLLNFYNYINSKSDSIGSNEKLFHARDNRLKEMYNLVFDSIPKSIESSIQFVVPEIEKE